MSKALTPRLSRRFVSSREISTNPGSIAVSAAAADAQYAIIADLVCCSICVTVVVLNVHFRSPQTHKMAPWVKRVFIHILPRLLVMRRPQYKFEPTRFTSTRALVRGMRGQRDKSYYPYLSSHDISDEHLTPSKRFHSRTSSKDDLSPSSLTDGARFGGSCLIHGPSLPRLPLHADCEDLQVGPSAEVAAAAAFVDGTKSPVLRPPSSFSHSKCPPEIHRSCLCVRFIAEHTKMLEDSTKVKEDWKYVAMVLDRLFLWIFTLAVLVGTAGIILQAPTLYDDRVPIDKKFSEFATTTVVKCPPQ
ncbi:hypothetical protein TKK_0017370 [Trichogramma kaykai]